MLKRFTEHPHSVGETYFQHLCFAGKTGLKLMGIGFCGIIHAVFPFWCVSTVSQFIKKLHARIYGGPTSAGVPDAGPRFKTEYHI